jgi:hypothetical protein
MNDNVKLNEHVDLCLNREQVRKVQKEMEFVKSVTANAPKRRKIQKTDFKK